MSAHYLTGSNESDRDAHQLMREGGDGDVVLFHSGTSYRPDEGSGARLDRRPFVAVQRPNHLANHASPSTRSISVPADHSRWSSPSHPPSPDSANRPPAASSSSSNGRAVQAIGVSTAEHLCRRSSKQQGVEVQWPIALSARRSHHHSSWHRSPSGHRGDRWETYSSSRESSGMPVSVKVYYGKGTKMEIRRFIFRPEIATAHSQHSTAAHAAGNSSRSASCPAVYAVLIEKIRQLYYGLNMHDVHFCWKDDDGDYVVFSSDDELKVAINNTTDNTLRIYIKDKELVPALKLRRPAPVDQPVRRFVSQDSVVGIDGGEAESLPNRAASRRSLPSDRVRQVHGEAFEASENGDEPSSLNTTPSPLVSNHHTSSPTTSNVVCSECQGSGRGVWYKCTCCNEFYLCSDCEHRGLHDQHIMVRTTTGHAATTR
uniref:PB1 domain-containing protein n=1 Tax=Plectus sambesii TaxID=2011161 RepID=A0A914W169_9BILA